MKKIIILLLITCQVFAQTPFDKGINLTNWFQSSSPGAIQFTKYTREDFENIKSLGCDVIRLPINLHSMTDGEPSYNLDPLFLNFLDHVIDWTEELNISLILDNHTFDPSVPTDPNIHNILIPVWKNMAEHFKNRSTLIYYEILNEPHGISNSVWNTIQQAAVNAIREIDSVHTIIVGPAGWNTFHDLHLMPVYPDTNLIYTFHFYDPFLFTHQGASWTDPSLVPLANVPFPYNSSEMPDLPFELGGTWVQDSYSSYPVDGTIAKVHELIDIADNFQKERNVKLLCGEFGVFMRNSNNKDRVEWYRVVREYLEEKGIAWTSWDYQGGFGLFEKNSNELFNYDLNIPLIQALGLNEVEQSDFTIQQERIPFKLYSDYIEQNIFNSTWNPNGNLTYYSENDPAQGEYCIEWSDAVQYSQIGFDFRPDKDLSYFADDTSAILFNISIKGDTPNTKFDVRFVDTKTDVPEDHPWRMSYEVDDNNNQISWDNEWHTLAIPLTDFKEQGSWDNNQWYDPIGAFDWTRIDKFEIVAEHQDLAGINFWFDEIKFTSSLVDVDNQNESLTFNLSQNYPNPFNPTTTIKYSIPNQTRHSQPQGESLITLKVYDVLGREITTLVNERQTPGNYEVIFNATSLVSGTYFYRLSFGNYAVTKQMLLIK